MTMHTGAEMVAELFDGYGVDHVFFVPTILNRALVEMERRTSIKRIVTHSEKAAAYMADGYGRASGRPGICMAQVVGAANLAAGLRDAHLGASPVLAITGGPFRHSHGRHQYQEAVDLPLFQPLTKSSTPVEDVATIPIAIRQAFRDATTGRPGPVHLQFAGHHGNILEQETADVDLYIEERFRCTPAFRPRASADDLAAAARLLAGAARPVMVLGTGVVTSGAGAAALALAQHLSMPIATSLGGKSAVPGDHPLNVGVVGLYSRETANRIVSEADLVFFVGSSTGSQVSHSWQLPTVGTPVIQCDISADVLGLNYRNSASLLGDARTCLEDLLPELDNAQGEDRSAWIARVEQVSAAWRQEWDVLLTSEAMPIRPERLCAELSDVLPSDAVVVADTGHAGMWTAGMLDLNKPDQGYLRAAGSLGWALPASLGAKCALPDRPVVTFTGDGGFWYHMPELETAARWGINTVVVVNNNHALNQEINIWTEAYGGSLQGRHEELWRFRNVNIAGVAHEMGVASFRVEKPGEIGSVMEQALAANRPAVVEVVTELEALAPKAFVPQTG